jgi:hypothetical protein
MKKRKRALFTVKSPHELIASVFSALSVVPFAVSAVVTSAVRSHTSFLFVP